MTKGAIRSVRELERLKITVVTDNYYDALRPDGVIGSRYRTTPGAGMHAEHGISYFVETLTAAGETGSFMFDFGVDAGGVANNLRLLHIETSRVDAFGLSHGHFDHWGAFVEILKQHRNAIRKDTPFYVGRDAFAHRYARRQGGGDLHDLGFLNREEIEGLGILKVVEVREVTEVVPGAYLTGFIEDVSGYEQVQPVFVRERENRLEQDLFEGEQALAFVVRGKGLVVLSGCAHRGIVNTTRCAQKISGIDRLHAVMGGFHLVNAAPEIIDATVAEISAMAPDYVVPAHCTGFEAMVRFREEMPEQFVLNTAGTTYVFEGK